MKGKGLSIFSDVENQAKQPGKKNIFFYCFFNFQSDFYFKTRKDQPLTAASPIWESHDNNVFKLLYESPPLNGFDEMIKLTNAGKLWKFPIDNEQGKHFSQFIYKIIGSI